LESLWSAAEPFGAPPRVKVLITSAEYRPS